MLKAKKDKCLVPECVRPASARGLCMSCNGTARRLIREGKTTEEKLLAEGKMAPKKAFRGDSYVVLWFLSNGKKVGRQHEPVAK